MQTPVAPPLAASSDPRFPIGPFRPQIDETTPPESAARVLETATASIADLPRAFRAALEGLGEEQLATPYRPGGWTLRQLAHHVADSHANAYIRLKLALTEEWPVIKPYDEKRWAELADVSMVPVETSLALLQALHARWAALLGSHSERDWRRGYMHPVDGAVTLSRMTELYSWHGRHHTAHIWALRKAENW